VLADLGEMGGVAGGDGGAVRDGDGGDGEVSAGFDGFLPRIGKGEVTQRRRFDHARKQQRGGDAEDVDVRPARQEK